MSMVFVDHYAVLGISFGASTVEVKSAYRNLARKFHPDTSGMAHTAEKFHAVHVAYCILSDPQKRDYYDRLWSLASSTVDHNPSPLKPEPKFQQWNDEAQQEAQNFANMSYREFAELSMRTLAQAGISATVWAISYMAILVAITIIGVPCIFLIFALPEGTFKIVLMLAVPCLLIGAVNSLGSAKHDGRFDPVTFWKTIGAMLGINKR